MGRDSGSCRGAHRGARRSPPAPLRARAEGMALALRPRSRPARAGARSSASTRTRRCSRTAAGQRRVARPVNLSPNRPDAHFAGHDPATAPRQSRAAGLHRRLRRAQGLPETARHAAPQLAGPRARRHSCHSSAKAAMPRAPNSSEGLRQLRDQDSGQRHCATAACRARRGRLHPRHRPASRSRVARGSRTLMPMPTTKYAGPAASPRRSIRMPAELAVAMNDVVRPLERELRVCRDDAAPARPRRPRRATARQASPARRDSSS